MSGENYVYDGSFRLGLGEIPVADFDETYEIERFPRQADQPGMIDWTEPLEGSDIVKEYFEETRGMSGNSKRFGGISFNWLRGLETPLMTIYWNGLFFPNNEGWQRVTVMTFDAKRGFIVLWATLIAPDETTGERAGNGYKGIKCEFIDAELAV